MLIIITFLIHVHIFTVELPVSSFNNIETVLLKAKVHLEIRTNFKL